MSTGAPKRGREIGRRSHSSLVTLVFTWFSQRSQRKNYEHGIDIRNRKESKDEGAS